MLYQKQMQPKVNPTIPPLIKSTFNVEVCFRHSYSYDCFLLYLWLGFLPACSRANSFFRVRCLSRLAHSCWGYMTVHRVHRQLTRIPWFSENSRSPAEFPLKARVSRQFCFDHSNLPSAIRYRQQLFMWWKMWLQYEKNKNIYYCTTLALQKIPSDFVTTILMNKNTGLSGTVL